MITTSIVLIPNNIGSLYGFAYSVIESMNIWMCYNRFKIMSSITYIQNETVKYRYMNTIIWGWLMSDTLCLATLTNHSLSSVIHYIGGKTFWTCMKQQKQRLIPSILFRKLVHESTDCSWDTTLNMCCIIVWNCGYWENISRNDKVSRGSRGNIDIY